MRRIFSAVFLLLSFGFCYPVFAQATTAIAGTCVITCKDGTAGLGSAFCSVDSDCKPSDCDALCTSAGGCDTTKPLTCSPIAPAASTTPPPKTFEGLYGLHDPLAGASIPSIIGGIIRYVMGFVGALFLLFFVYGGLLYVVANDAKGADKAKKALKNAVIGIAIVIASYALIGVFIQIAAFLTKA